MCERRGVDAIEPRYYSVCMRPADVARRLCDALIDPNPSVWRGLLADGVILRIWSHAGSDSYGGAELARRRLIADAARWSQPRLEIFNVLADGPRVAVELRIRDELDGVASAHSWSVFATLSGERATHIDIYRAEPIPFDRDHTWIAPASSTDAELTALFEAQRFSGDARQWVTRDRRSHTSARFRVFGSLDANPQRNQVRAARWTDAEADEHIETLIAAHRVDGIGFRWHVDEHDRPRDLAERLVARGFEPVAEMSSMILRLEGAPPLPASDEVALEPVDGSDPVNSEESLQVLGAAFSWDDTLIEAARAWWLPRLRSELRPYPQRFYLARIDGEPVGFGALALGPGAADLSGAGTIPTARGRGVYTALLARRLADARAHGYEVVMVGTTPMSKRVVANYGFAQIGTTRIYEWTPDCD